MDHFRRTIAYQYRDTNDSHFPSSRQPPSTNGRTRGIAPLASALDKYHEVIVTGVDYIGLSGIPLNTLLGLSSAFKRRSQAPNRRQGQETPNRQTLHLCINADRGA
jgi:hypothetical protein